MSREYSTVEEVANRLKLHRKTVLRYIQDGRLSAVRFGKSYRIDPRSVAALLPGANPENRAAEAQVTAIVEVPDISASEAERIVAALQGLVIGKGQSGDPVRFTSAFDPNADQLKLVVYAAPGATGTVLSFLDSLLNH